jgi:hypothetical protein
MKAILNYILLALTVTVSVTACDKVDNLPYYGNGTAPVLSASATTIAPAPADSNNTVLTLSWTSPNYATDSGNVKYTIEMDTAGTTFSKPYTKIVSGTKSASFTAKELNDVLVSKGYPFGVPVSMDVRVTSSYANNNERIASNTLTLQLTPYKVPPKVALPTSNRLFIVGDATDFGWSNDATPAFPAAREFTRLDETHWGGIFNFKGNGSYKLLQTQGEWSTQYHKVLGDALSGTFEQKDADPAFSGPETPGLYKVVVDFQTGNYTVEPFTQEHGLPENLFIVGGATPGGWNNPVPVPGQQFTRETATQFELASIALTSGEKYLFLPENGNWDKKFGVDTPAADNLGGSFKPQGGDIPAPAESGNYKIAVDFINNTYTLTRL